MAPFLTPLPDPGNSYSGNVRGGGGFLRIFGHRHNKRNQRSSSMGTITVLGECCRNAKTHPQEPIVVRRGFLIPGQFHSLPRTELSFSLLNLEEPPCLLDSTHSGSPMKTLQAYWKNGNPVVVFQQNIPCRIGKIRIFLREPFSKARKTLYPHLERSDHIFRRQFPAFGDAFPGFCAQVGFHAWALRVFRSFPGAVNSASRGDQGIEFLGEKDGSAACGSDDHGITPADVIATNIHMHEGAMA